MADATPIAWIHGAGAVGLGMASFLMQAGWQVGVLARPATAQEIDQHGIRRTGILGEAVHQPGTFAVATSLPGLARCFPNPPAQVLVCVKSYDTHEVAADLARHAALLGDAAIVLCQNGWGNAEAAQAHLPAARIHCARVITGFRRPQPWQVEVTVHALPVRMGSLWHADVGKVAPLCDALARGGLPAEATPTIGRDLWAKLLYNAMLNPLGALLHATYGQLGQHPATRAIMLDVLAEGWAVMHAHGHTTHWATAADFLTAFDTQQLPTTARHRSSMLQDIEAGRRTEIDALNGAIVRLGGSAGIPTPVNATLVRQVQALSDLGAR